MIDPTDLVIDIHRPGVTGSPTNPPFCAVRVTHMPSRIVEQREGYRPYSKMKAECIEAIERRLREDDDDD